MAGGHIAVLGALHGDGIGGDTAATATAGGGRLSEGNDHLDSGIVIVGGGDGYGQGDGIASRAAGQSVGHLTGGIHRPAVNRHSAGRALGGALGIGQRPGVSGHTGSADGRLAAGHGVLLAVGDILQRRGGSLGDLKLGAGRNDQLIVVGQERSIVLEFQRTLLDFIGSHILARISCQLAIKGRGLAGYFAGVGVGQRGIGRAELLALAGVGRDGQRGRGDAGIGDGQLLGGCQRIVAGGDGSRGKGDGVCISNIGAVVNSGAVDGEGIRTAEGGCLHTHGNAAGGSAVIDLGGGATGLFQIAAVQHLGGDGQHSSLAADVGAVLVGGCYSVGARGLGQTCCCIQRAGTAGFDGIGIGPVTARTGSNRVVKRSIFVLLPRAIIGQRAVLEVDLAADIGLFLHFDFQLMLGSVNDLAGGHQLEGACGSVRSNLKGHDIIVGSRDLIAHAGVLSRIKTPGYIVLLLVAVLVIDCGRVVFQPLAAGADNGGNGSLAALCGDPHDADRCRILVDGHSLGSGESAGRGRNGHSASICLIRNGQLTVVDGHTRIVGDAPCDRLPGHLFAVLIEHFGSIGRIRTLRCAGFSHRRNSHAICRTLDGQRSRHTGSACDIEGDLIGFQRTTRGIQLYCARLSIVGHGNAAVGGDKRHARNGCGFHRPCHTDSGHCRAILVIDRVAAFAAGGRAAGWYGNVGSLGGGGGNDGLRSRGVLGDGHSLGIGISLGGGSLNPERAGLGFVGDLQGAAVQAHALGNGGSGDFPIDRHRAAGAVIINTRDSKRPLVGRRGIGRCRGDSQLQRRVGNNVDPTQRRSTGLGVSLGEGQHGVVDAGDGVVTADGVIQRFGEGLAGFGRQGDSGVVELLGLGGGRGGDRFAAGVGALKPLHLGDGIGCAGINGAVEVQRLTLDWGINRGGHAGDGRLGDGDGCGCNIAVMRGLSHNITIGACCGPQGDSSGSPLCDLAHNGHQDYFTSRIIQASSACCTSGYKCLCSGGVVKVGKNTIIKHTLKINEFSVFVVIKGRISLFRFLRQRQAGAGV